MIDEQTSIGKYKLVKRVGEGSYGVVYKAQDPTTGNIVALKKIVVETGEEGVPVHCLREIGILKKMAHPNVVKLHEVIYLPQTKKVVLVFEFIDKTLSQIIDDKSSSSLNPYLCKVVLDDEEPDVPAIERN